MQEGAKTPARNYLRRLAAAWAACALCATATSAAATPPALQELAGPSRDPDGTTFRQAMAEHHEASVLTILFAAGSARLTPSATRMLDSIDGLAGNRWRIEGHAGRDPDLAARRAKAVAVYLAQNCGVAAAHLQTVTAPLADDRRVAVVDLGP